MIVRLPAISTLAVLLTLPLYTPVAGAVCLDPATSVSGYTVPLDTEVRKADAIVIGLVLSARALHEDPADPDGVTADAVTVSVLASLKGRLLTTFVIRNENTSARYAMSAGEEHLLFVSRDDGAWWVDSCGNSARMPAGRGTVQRIRTIVETSR